MRRRLFDTLYAHLGKKPCTVLVGARQTGKTTLLKQLQEQAQQDGWQCAFFNLEQRDVRTAFNESPKNLLAYLPATAERICVFVDEVQYLDDPSNFIKLIYDEYAERIKLVVTGSSAFYIDEKFNDSLAGRKRVFRLDTCSFEESLEISGQHALLAEYRRITDNDTAKTTMLPELEAALDSYIVYGGYPAVAVEHDKREKVLLLKELRDSYLKKDVLEAGVRSEDAFYRLYTALAAQSGSQLNVHELSSTLGVAQPTAQSYLKVLQKSFHIVLVKPFFRNVRKELTKMPKVYLMDSGMRNMLLNYFPERLGLMDDGALFETYVFHCLQEKNDLDAIRYWRTADGKEVDFVVDSPWRKAAFEVKFSERAVRTKKYAAFRDAYPDYPLSFVCKEPFSEARLREQKFS